MSQANEKIDEFWRWFQTHRSDFDALTDTDAPFWDYALGRLKRIDEHFWFELSRPDDEVRELIITAEGHKDLFELVDAMISLARNIPGWKFTCLKPAMGFDFKADYEGIPFDPTSMWFLPLNSKSEPQNLGIRVGVPNLTPAVKRQADNAVLVILDTALGERTAALDIQHVEVAALPASPESNGYIELPKLPAYIKWRKGKRGIR